MNQEEEEAVAAPEEAFAAPLPPPAAAASPSKTAPPGPPKKRKVYPKGSLFDAPSANKYEDAANVPNHKYHIKDSLRGGSGCSIALTAANHSMFGEVELQR